MHPGLEWIRLRLSPGNAVYERDERNERAHSPDSGKTPASMNAMLRERFTPAASSDAATPAQLRATVTGFHSTCSKGTSRAELSML